MDKLEYGLSIIIPVYNSKRYIIKCIDSIKPVHILPIQIIIIDDGSTDGSNKLIKSIVDNDARIEFERTPNKGVSHARNLGLKRVKYKYVLFVDSDDMCDITNIERTIQEIDSIKYAILSYQVVDENGNIEKSVIYPRQQDRTTIYNLINELLLGDSKGYQGYLWNKIFDAEVIIKNNLQFDEDIAYNEDRLFILRYLLSACNGISNRIEIMKVSAICYIYRDNRKGKMGALKSEFKPVFLDEIKALLRFKTEIERTSVRNKGFDGLIFNCNYIIAQHSLSILLRWKNTIGGSYIDWLNSCIDCRLSDMKSKKNKSFAEILKLVRFEMRKVKG